MPKEKAETFVSEVYVPPAVPPVAPPTPPTKHYERHGEGTVPRVRRYPQIIAGVCEYHGTVNPHVPGQEQYLYCPDDGKHPKWGEIQCSYCEDYKDPKDVIKKSTINIYDSPTNPNELIVVCDNFTCVEKHRARFKVA